MAHDKGGMYVVYVGAFLVNKNHLCCLILDYKYKTGNYKKSISRTSTD